MTISSDGHALSAAPMHRRLRPRDVVEARDLAWDDGRVDWPEILGACSAWSLDVATASISVHASGGPVLDDAQWDESPSGARAASGSRLSLRFDPARVEGRLDEPATLFALHALAGAWPEGRLVLKLPPEHVGWR